MQSPSVEAYKVKVPKLPVLKELIQLPSHFRTCEVILHEDRVPLSMLKSKTAIIESLAAYSFLVDTANSLLHLDWPLIRDRLISEFCDFNLMRQELEKRLTTMKFDASKMNEFIQKGRQLWSLRIPGTDHVWFVTHLLRTVPLELIEKVVCQVRSDKGRNVDWRTQDVGYLLDILSDLITTRQAASSVRRSVDNVNHIQPKNANEKKAPSRHPIQTWIDSLQGPVFYVRSEDSAKLQQLRAASEQVRECSRKADGVKYYLAAFPSKEVGNDTMSQIFGRGMYHEFLRKN
jgi:hypothetical protein